MIITIEHINKEAMKKLIDECTEDIILEYERESEDLFTITLNKNAILKTFGDLGVMIDLAGNKCFFEENDYFTITIE